MTEPELFKLRDELIQKITLTNLEWVDVTLTDGTGNTANDVKVKVTRPVVVDGYFVPVKPKETWDFARRFAAFPLTRAVADQFYLQSEKYEFVGQYPALRDFEKFTKTLNAVNYGTGTVKSGFNKLWLLSSHGKSINYGAYTRKGGAATGGGKRLKGTGSSVFQDIGGAHNDEWWDYSQLLQLMQAAGPLTINGKQYSLGMAIVEGFPQVWDEDKKLKSSDLP